MKHGVGHREVRKEKETGRWWPRPSGCACLPYLTWQSQFLPKRLFRRMLQELLSEGLILFRLPNIAVIILFILPRIS